MTQHHRQDVRRFLADYRALGTYHWSGGDPLATAVTALIGDSDPMVTVEDARTWRAHTTGDFALKVFPGGHFYLFDRPCEVAAAVAEGLLSQAPSS